MNPNKAKNKIKGKKQIDGVSKFQILKQKLSQPGLIRKEKNISKEQRSLRNQKDPPVDSIVSISEDFLQYNDKYNNNNDLNKEHQSLNNARKRTHAELDQISQEWSKNQQTDEAFQFESLSTISHASSRGIIKIGDEERFNTMSLHKIYSNPLALYKPIGFAQSNEKVCAKLKFLIPYIPSYLASP